MIKHEEGGIHGNPVGSPTRHFHTETLSKICCAYWPMVLSCPVLKSEGGLEETEH